MANIPDWKYWLRKVTIKDAIIVILLIVISCMGAFIRQTGKSVNKLNAENESLQLENERISHMLGLTTEALRRQIEKNPAPNADVQLRDPFRPDHPTREEVEEQRESDMEEEEQR